MSKISQIEDQFMIPLYKKRDITLVRGKGVHVFDEKGKKYLDFTGQYGTTVLGHGNAEVKRAVLSQMDSLVSVHNSFYCEPRALLAEKISSLLPKSLNQVFFFSTGTECAEAALKFARAATGRTHIIAAKGAYHGRTMGALSMTGQSKYREPFTPLVPDVHHVPFNDLPAMKEAVGKRAAAVILEPIQAESGVRFPDEKYLEGVRALCSQHGALLIFDEIQVGTYRTGTFLASQQYGAVPDIVCISKAIANGLPLGAVVTTKAVSSKLPAGCHGTTFGGNALCCAAGLATLDAIKKYRLPANVKAMGNFLIRELNKLVKKSGLIREVRGRGLIIGIEFKQKVSPLLKALQEKGVLVLPAGPTILRILPPYTITKKDCQVFLNVFSKVIS